MLAITVAIKIVGPSSQRARFRPKHVILRVYHVNKINSALKTLPVTCGNAAHSRHGFSLHTSPARRKY